VSPEVRPDRTIVFRLKAPEAARVTLSFGGLKAMSKDAAGVWSATVGPVIRRFINTTSWWTAYASSILEIHD